MCGAAASNSNTLEEQWNLTFYEKDDNFVSCVADSNSGGYIAAGGMGVSAINTDNDAFLYEISQDGALVWATVFGGDQQDSFTTVLNNGEQGYVAIGNTASFGPISTSAWMVQVDNNGNEIWNRTFLQNHVTIVYSGQKTSERGFILAGLRSYPENPVALIIKTDSEGNEQWSKTFGSGRLYIYDYFKSVQETPEGDFVMAGSTVSYSRGNMEDGWLVKVDSAGNELWNQSFGDIDIDGLDSVVVCSDGGYIVAGRSKLYGEPLFNAWMLKTDTDGKLLWEKRYFEGSDSYFSSIIEAPDGNYVIAGSVGNVPDGSVQASFGVDHYQGFLIKIDENGDEIWSHIYDGYSDSAFSAVTEFNGNYAVAGSMIPEGTDESDSLLVVFDDVDAEGFVETGMPEESSEEKSPLSFTVTLISIGISFIALKRHL
jgi:hypothetical protein